MRKFLIGCGVTMGVLVLLGIVGSWVLVSKLKKELPDLKRIESQQEELSTRFGAPDEFLPPLDGRVDPQRIESYLAVREALPNDDSAFVSALTQIADPEKRVDEAKGWKKVQEAFRIAKDGLGVARAATAFLAVRDSVLLAENMGTGEYLFYTALGPILQIDHRPERCTPDTSAEIETQDPGSLDRAQNEILSIFREQLGNARRALRAQETRTEDEDAWLAILKEEIDHGRIGDRAQPFAEGLPVLTQESLAPYLDRLRNSLPDCRETWALELHVATERDNSGFQVNVSTDDDD